MKAGFIGGPFDEQIRDVTDPPQRSLYYRNLPDAPIEQPSRLKESLEVKEMRALTGRQHYKTEADEIAEYFRKSRESEVRYELHYWADARREYPIYVAGQMNDDVARFLVSRIREAENHN